VQLMHLYKETSAEPPRMHQNSTQSSDAPEELLLRMNTSALPIFQ